MAEPLERDAWFAANPNVPPVVADVIFETVALFDQGQPALPLFVAVAGRHGIDVARQMNADVLCTTISRVLTISEMNRRCAILATLPDTIRIAVASPYLPTQLRGRPHITHLGFIDDFYEIRKLMGRSRIVLNCTNKFPDGAHERIWYGMAEGAAVVTDASRYLERDFVHGRDILYLPRHADLRGYCWRDRSTSRRSQAAATHGRCGTAGLCRRPYMAVTPDELVRSGCTIRVFASMGR